MTPPVDVSIQPGPDPDESVHAESLHADPAPAGDGAEDAAEIDARAIPHRERHPRIFARFARLAPGGSFVLANGHDPRPLRAQFEDLHAGAFTWDYLDSGPQLWRVRIGRRPDPAAQSTAQSMAQSNGAAR